MINRTDKIMIKTTPVKRWESDRRKTSKKKITGNSNGHHTAWISSEIDAEVIILRRS